MSAAHAPPSRSRPFRASLRALTLVELLVALTILVVVSTSALLIFRGITRAWKAGELKTQQYQQARLLFDLFERELSSCVSSPSYPLIGINAADDPAAHLAKDSMADELFFVGTLPGRSGFIERGYWVNANHDLLCHDDESGDGDYQTGVNELCGREVSQFTVSYFNGTDWLDRWPAHPGGELPKAIHITLMLGRQKPEKFETVIYVPTS